MAKVIAKYISRTALGVQCALVRTLLVQVNNIENGLQYTVFQIDMPWSPGSINTYKFCKRICFVSTPFPFIDNF